MKWIKVSEKLPKDGEDILVYCNDGEEEYYTPANYDKGVWFDCLFNMKLDMGKITHWMSITKPSKED